MYEKHVVPIFQAYNLVAQPEDSRATLDSVFTRMFAFKTPGEFDKIREAILHDPAFEASLKVLGATFGTSESDGLMRVNFDIYRSRTGSGHGGVSRPCCRRRRRKPTDSV